MFCIRAMAIIATYALMMGASQAQTYPARTVRLVVPFAPGGVTDLAARLVGQTLSTKWKQQVVIENKPGAGGVIGVELAARSDPDGYTLLMATNGEITINPSISSKTRYDSQRDIVPIAMVTSTPFVWSANLNAGINSLSELVARAKQKPGDLAYSSAGIGSSAHMATEQFAAATGIKLLHVPYRGGAPAAAAIVSGDVPVAAVALSSALPVIESGKVKLLATTSLKRSTLAPDVPTVNETGVLKDFRSEIWTALFAPAGTPAAIVSQIEADVLEVLRDPAVIARLQQAGADPVGMPADQLRAYIPKELEAMKKLAQEAAIKVD